VLFWERSETADVDSNANINTGQLRLSCVVAATLSLTLLHTHSFSNCTTSASEAWITFPVCIIRPIASQGRATCPAGGSRPRIPPPASQALRAPQAPVQSIVVPVSAGDKQDGTERSLFCASKRQNKKAKRPLTDGHPCNKDFRGSCRRSLSHHQSHQRDLSDNVKPSGNRSKSGTWPQQPLSQDLVKTASDLG
jgi:hypothetical protein